MNVKAAAHSTLGHIPNLHSLKAFPPACDAVTAHRLEDLLKRIESGEINGDRAHRCLGWVQGALCARGAGTREEFNTINRMVDAI